MGRKMRKSQRQWEKSGKEEDSPQHIEMGIMSKEDNESDRCEVKEKRQNDYEEKRRGSEKKKVLWRMYEKGSSKYEVKENEGNQLRNKQNCLISYPLILYTVQQIEK